MCACSGHARRGNCQSPRRDREGRAGNHSTLAAGDHGRQHRPAISSINLTYNNTGTIGEQDADVQIALKESHAPTDDFIRRLREQLPRRFPGITFSFLPADIVSQILNFGSPAPINIQIRGATIAANMTYAQELLARLRRVPGLADARIQQSRSEPAFQINVDRARAQYAGVTSATSTTVSWSISPARARSNPPIGSTRRTVFPT